MAANMAASNNDMQNQRMWFLTSINKLDWFFSTKSSSCETKAYIVINMCTMLQHFKMAANIAAD